MKNNSTKSAKIKTAKKSTKPVPKKRSTQAKFIPPVYDGQDWYDGLYQAFGLYNVLVGHYDKLCRQPSVKQSAEEAVGKMVLAAKEYIEQFQQNKRDTFQHWKQQLPLRTTRDLAEELDRLVMMSGLLHFGNSVEPSSYDIQSLLSPIAKEVAYLWEKEEALVDVLKERKGGLKSPVHLLRREISFHFAGVESEDEARQIREQLRPQYQKLGQQLLDLACYRFIEHIRTRPKFLAFAAKGKNSSEK